MLGAGISSERGARSGFLPPLATGQRRTRKTLGIGLCLVAGALLARWLLDGGSGIELALALCLVSIGLVLLFRSEQPSRAATAASDWDYRLIFENAVEGIFLVDARGRVSAANPALARILGYSSSEEMMGGIANVSHQVYVDPAARKVFQERLKRRRRLRVRDTLAAQGWNGDLGLHERSPARALGRRRREPYRHGRGHHPAQAR